LNKLSGAKIMSNIAITYKHNLPLDPQDVVRVFQSSGITRPVNDLPRIARMFSAPALIISAWHQGRLVGLSRSLTDYAYCCYLSDLAVDKEYQGCGIGKELVQRTRDTVGDEVSIILLSAPGAMSYYPCLDFTSTDSAFLIKRKR
jgi:GNAT superfamily N-acetyltransferase